MPEDLLVRRVLDGFYQDSLRLSNLFATYTAAIDLKELPTLETLPVYVREFVLVRRGEEEAYIRSRIEAQQDIVRGIEVLSGPLLKRVYRLAMQKLELVDAFDARLERRCVERESKTLTLRDANAAIEEIREAFKRGVESFEEPMSRCRAELYLLQHRWETLYRLGGNS